MEIDATPLRSEQLKNSHLEARRRWLPGAQAA
jgi:hypothetical protein